MTTAVQAFAHHVACPTGKIAVIQLNKQEDGSWKEGVKHIVSADVLSPITYVYDTQRVLIREATDDDISKAPETTA